MDAAEGGGPDGPPKPSERGAQHPPRRKGPSGLPGGVGAEASGRALEAPGGLRREPPANRRSTPEECGAQREASTHTRCAEAGAGTAAAAAGAAGPCWAKRWELWGATISGS